MALDHIWNYNQPLTLAGSSKKNEDILLKFYRDTDRRLKKLIIEAINKGNNIDYLLKLQEEARKEIAALDTKYLIFANEAVRFSYKNGIKKQEQGYKKLEVTFSPIATANFGGLHKEAIKILAENTYKPLHQVTKIIGRNTQEFLKRENFKDTQATLKAVEKFVDSKALREAGITNVRGIVVGDTTWKNAAKAIEKELASKDIFKVPYYTKDGDIKCYVGAKDYSQMVARTTTAEAMREGTKNSILDTFENNDLVQIVGGGSNECDDCAALVGNIYSLEGLTEGFPLIDEAEAAGLFHPNCTHSFAVTEDVIKTYDDNNIDY
jgi:hypothetical protein